MLLVVDDHEDSRYVLVRMLFYEGYEAIGVASGQEALIFLGANKPSLVVLDYNMPDMDGLAVFSEMKKDDRLRNIPVIMFSANDGQVKEKALLSGVDAYIVKGSLDWADLHREIIRLVGAGTPREQQRIDQRLRDKNIG